MTNRLLPGDPNQLGPRATDEGVLFSVRSASSEALELCLFDTAGKATQQWVFDACSDGVWHGFLPEAKPGLAYGLRAHGRFAPDEGLFHNHNQLLLDPYARALAGQYIGHSANHVCRAVEPGEEAADQIFVPSAGFAVDNAPYVPRSVVVGNLGSCQPGITLAPNLRVVYEAHVGGLTTLNNAVDAPLRGSFLGAASPAVINHLRALGVSSLQLLPVHSFIDEPHLLTSGLHNYWGYNTLNFFTPHAGYATNTLDGTTPGYEQARMQLRDMVRALHDANIEVILDVVYNHTCEGGADGPTLSFRGLDNLAYYRTDAAHQHRYVNDTGCGNTLNFDSPAVQQLTLDSLRYFSQDMEVDGFRFDLAVSLGREATGFNAKHAMLEAIRTDPALSRKVLIAEPWDIGPGGYQTGGFAAPWMEWNDHYRDALRSFWRGDAGAQANMSKRLHGSSDLFENGGRGVHTSVNFVSSHDGFTLADLVAFEDKHNEANGEDNRDGHSHNLSDNMGQEGPTENPDIQHARDRRSRAILATLIFSQGTPMLLAGDELKNSQQGNNNAYCQNNAIGWLQWDSATSTHVNLLRRCIDIRNSLRHFRVMQFIHEPWESPEAAEDRVCSNALAVGWLRSDGTPMQDFDWSAGAASTALPFAQLLSTDEEIVLIALNPSFEDTSFILPIAGVWQWLINSDHPSGRPLQVEAEHQAKIPAQALCVLSLPSPSLQRNHVDAEPISALNTSARTGTNE